MCWELINTLSKFLKTNRLQNLNDAKPSEKLLGHNGLKKEDSKTDLKPLK